MYLNNYIIEDTDNNTYAEKLEKIIQNINKFNLSENQQNKLLEIIEQIINLDNKNCEILNIQMNELLGFNL